MDPFNLSFWQKLQIALTGKTCVGYNQKPGWIKPIKHYAFKCPRHGYVVNYPQGYYHIDSQHIPITNDNGSISELRCPKCIMEEKTVV